MRDHNQTVAELATQTSAAIDVLERYAVNYYCKGHRTVADACKERGVPVEILFAEIEAAAEAEQGLNWEMMPLHKLIECIVSWHHGYLRQELPRLNNLLDKTISVYGLCKGDVLSRLRASFQRFRDHIEEHIRKEEVIVFPAIASIEEAAISGFASSQASLEAIFDPIQLMETEHESAAESLDQIMSLARCLDQSRACMMLLTRGFEAVERDMHEHMHLENNILFRRVLALRTPPSL
jgi:regulator of cell morphogenesis and NO signaling